MELNPFVGHDIEIKGRQYQRLQQTIRFVDWNTYELGNVLCIGEPNTFDKAVLEELHCNSYSFTTGDLDGAWDCPKARYDTIFCFEVLEHLANPLKLLRELKMFNATILISVPNHLLRRHWRNIHYHEIDDMRMRFLFKQGGYEVIDYEKIKLYPRVSDITGIRPFLRYITGYSWFISRTDRLFYAII